MDINNRLKGIVWSLFDRYVSVTPLKRTKEEQSSLDRESRRIQLYFHSNCCQSVSVRRYCRYIGLRVVEKDVERVNAYRNELLKGSRSDVRLPCLRVECRKGIKWFYTEDEIKHYLEKRFSH